MEGLTRRLLVRHHGTLEEGGIFKVLIIRQMWKMKQRKQESLTHFAPNH